MGKTWLLKEFGKTQFDDMAYVSLDNNDAARALFESGYDMERIVAGLSLLTGVRVKAGSTLLVLDEVQACRGRLPRSSTFARSCRSSPSPLLVRCWGCPPRRALAIRWEKWTCWTFTL